MSNLPTVELERIDSVLNNPLSAIQLCAMRNCGEEFDAPPSSGIFSVSWGIILHFKSFQLAISWTEDSIGDPFRISVAEASKLLDLESLVAQDVSADFPWSRYIGNGLDAYKTLSYKSNYAHEPTDNTWRSVPWGILFDFGPQSLLVAAATHEYPFRGAPCADELTLAFSDTAIQRLPGAYKDSHSKCISSLNLQLRMTQCD